MWYFFLFFILFLINVYYAYMQKLLIILLQ